MTVVGVDAEPPAVPFREAPELAGRPPTMGRMLLDRVAATPAAEAFRWPVPDPDGGPDTWASMTWRRTGERVERIAAGLLAAGVRPQQRIAIISGTRLEWALADYAVLCAGAATTTVYPTSQPDDVRHILADSGSVLAFVSDRTHLDALRALRDDLPDLARVVLFDDGDGGRTDGDGDWVSSLAELERRGAEHLAEHPSAVQDAVASVGPKSLATLIYTSGTTGRPKGVRLVHDCWTAQGVSVRECGLNLSPDDVHYLWLPLSHGFGKMLLAAQLAVGFTSVVDGRVEKIVDGLAATRPTFMAAAPRVFEKARGRVLSTVEADGGVKLRLFRWAFSVGDRVASARRDGRRVGPLLAAEHAVADRLVLAKIRARFGGRMRAFISGSAALSTEVAAWFDAAGLPIMEGYGLTESSAGTVVNTAAHRRLGTVGRPLPGFGVRVADDGEVLLAGPCVMRGYHGLPEQTAEALDADGWLHTGDIGELDADGFLRITDRKKDLIKTSGGKYVAPQVIEVRLTGLCPLVGHVVVHGEGRNYVTALVALDPDEARAWAAGHGGGANADAAVLAARDDLRAVVAAAVRQLNERLNRWETIKDFRILPDGLTVDSGDLTPSMKVRRKAVERRYAALLADMYPDVRH